MAFSLGNQDKLALMLTLFGSQRRLAEAMGVSHQRIGRWLHEGDTNKLDPETGEILKGRGVKQIPKDAGHLIDTVFNVYKQVVRDQARADGLFYNSRIPVFLNRPRLDNGKQGMRIYAEHTQFLRPEIRINFTALVQRTKHFVQASYRSEINVFSYVGSSPTEGIRKRKKRYTNADFETSAEAIIEAGGRLMPVFTKYENISPGTSTGLVIRNLEAKLDKHSPHATKLADMWLFQLKTPTQQNETPAAKRIVQRAKSRGAKRTK